ncbi:MAG: hypothetical protein QG620_870 [Patescibacteria group bacterium]|nr:hypothetical protein [Patescibacteria group bacterium]
MFETNTNKQKITLAIILVVLLATFVFFIQAINKNFQDKKNTENSKIPTQTELLETEMKKQESELDKIHENIFVQKDAIKENTDTVKVTPTATDETVQEKELDAMRPSAKLTEEEAQAQEDELDALFKK